jgi:hypothetical protein
MPRDLTIVVHGEWRAEVGDGLPCFGCGRPCRPRQWRLMLRVNDDPDWLPRDHAVCDFCHLEEGENGRAVT